MGYVLAAIAGLLLAAAAVVLIAFAGSGEL